MKVLTSLTTSAGELWASHLPGSAFHHPSTKQLMLSESAPPADCLGHSAVWGGSFGPLAKGSRWKLERNLVRTPFMWPALGLSTEHTYSRWGGGGGDCKHNLRGLKERWM